MERRKPVLRNVSVEEYFRFEEAAEEKHEYRDGNVYRLHEELEPVPDSPENHAAIGENIARLFKILRAVQLGKVTAYHVADGGDREVLVCVLPPSIAENVRSLCLDHAEVNLSVYSWMFVWEAEAVVEFGRSRDGVRSWIYELYLGLEKEIRMEGGALVSLRELYSGVVFPWAEDDRGPR